MRWATAAVAAAVITLGALPASAGPHDGLPEVPEPPDRSTPRKAAESYIHAAREGDYLRAAYVLDLRGVPRAEQAERGPRLAERLKAVLDRALWLEMAKISDEPEGDAKDGGTRTEVLGRIPLEKREVPIELSRMTLRDGTDGWVFSRQTVDRIDALYQRYGPHWIAERLPPVFSRVQLAEVHLWQWLGLLVAVLLAWGLGLAVGSGLLRIGRGIASRTAAEWDDLLMDMVRGPTRMFVAILLLWALIEPLALAMPAQQAVNRLLLILLVADVAWFAQRVVQFLAETVEGNAVKQAAGEPDAELRVRGVQTQVRMLRRVASVVILVVAVALMLVQFDVVRTVGMSMLASAGIVGIVVGFAAQQSIANLLKGVQLSVTQPIRIGDTVIVEGEWGTIEEINLTYVVVHIWDQRRLIVPISRFLDAPFQNWTKTSKELLGTVFVYADYRVPVPAVREELDRILEDNPLWDGRSKGVVVTDATERTVQLRPLVSAKDASDLWNLRCEVREKLITWLQQYEGGKYLPRVRVEGEEEGGPTKAAGAA
ncbi:MAG: mechanosensitive ion channel family protein [Myxococcota bacterium]